MRLEQASQGTITIADKDISLLPEQVLRSCIAFVPQDPMLFTRSIKENILYGSLNATDEQMVQATVQAEIHDFIVSLPSGYQTVIGESGIALSGGQRQRLIIARALLKNAPIIILDEPTAALDPISEQSIKKVIYNLAHTKTVLIITHRLSTAEHLDRILVFDQGTIVEDGTHAQLLTQKGLYTHLWRSSYTEFLEDDEEEIL
jgi:ATP-binding cassette subfamily B protein